MINKVKANKRSFGDDNGFRTFHYSRLRARNYRGHKSSLIMLPDSKVKGTCQNNKKRNRKKET